MTTPLLRGKIVWNEVNEIGMEQIPNKQKALLCFKNSELKAYKWEQKLN